MASRVVEKFAALPYGSRAWMTEPSRVTELLCVSRLGGSVRVIDSLKSENNILFLDGGSTSKLRKEEPRT